MADDMRDRQPKTASEPAEAGGVVARGGPAVSQLPTLQRNALRKIFDRHDFTAEEVASLGYRRLQQAEGIGNKGLVAISEWLKLHGFELKPPDVSCTPKPELPKRMRRNIESAVRLLRTHGYVVLRGSEVLKEINGSG